MPYYPYRLTVTRNTRASLAPVVGAQISVYKLGSGERVTIYQDSLGTPGTEIDQNSFFTDSNGQVAFYVAAGQYRIDAKLDGTTVQSIEDVVADQEMIAIPVIGELPSGVQDGSNADFTLASVPNPNRVAVYVNGLRLAHSPSNAVPTANQFSISANTITLGTPPQVSDVILVDYWVV
jgi:hypothetical protein